MYVLLESEHIDYKNRFVNPDLFTYREAMSSEHRHHWIEAAVKEIESLDKMDCWEEIPITKATTQILPGTWAFRVKRAPDGSFKKFKPVNADILESH